MIMLMMEVLVMMVVVVDVMVVVVVQQVLQPGLHDCELSSHVCGDVLVG